VFKSGDIVVGLGHSIVVIVELLHLFQVGASSHGWGKINECPQLLAFWYAVYICT
jgi:hypothetical protein